MSAVDLTVADARDLLVEKHSKAQNSDELSWAHDLSGNVKIFVSYYKEAHKPYIEGLNAQVFQPWDVQFNKNSELLEFDLFRELQRKYVDNADKYYGVYSWKFLAKTGMSKDYILAQIADCVRQDADVIVLNPAIANNAFFSNGFEQGNINHPNLLYIFDLLGFGNLTRLVLPYYTFAMCSYIVAKPSFWTRYIDFVEGVLANANDLCGKNSEFRSKFCASANYEPNPSLNYKPFIVERLLQLFLIIENVRLGYIEPDEECFKKKFVENASFVKDLYERRKQVDFSKGREEVTSWLKGRKQLFQNRKNLIMKILNQDMYDNALHGI